MAILRELALLGCLLLAGCQTLAIAAGRPTGDTKDWKTYRVFVGDRIVQFVPAFGQGGGVSLAAAR